MPYLKSNDHGDLYIRIVTEVPESLTSKQKQLLEEFRKIERKTKSCYKEIF